MKIKKDWYTLIELLLIVIVMWTLTATFRSKFEPGNKDTLYWETCVNNIYWDISSFINNALTSKNILSWVERVSPEKYYININPQKNTIILKYNKPNDNTDYILKELNLTWEMPLNYYCQNNLYTMILSWNETNVTINKWMKENSELKGFNINNRNSFYEKIFLKKCPYKNNSNDLDYEKCKDLWLYEINVATQNIKRSTCLDINLSWGCDGWTK